jgi:amidase
MAEEEFHYLELIELTQRIHAKQISPVEATRAELDRIEAIDKTLCSYALVTPETALEQAREAEAEISRGIIKGPLHGAPIAVKDLCWTKGIPTAAGMPIHRDFRPDRDATVVQKLRAAGAIILGKLQLTEGAYADHHPAIKPPVNPWNTAHWSGASSSGSGVATAAGLCYGSLGSDTGGSIRFPSAANGVTGLKPSWGRVSRYGVFELAATLDHIGPMARSAADTAALLGATAGRDDHDPTASLEPVPDYLSGINKGIRGLRIGVDPNWNRIGTDARTIQVVDEAIAIVRNLGGDIREVTFPDPTDVIAEWPVHCGIETAVAHESTYPARKAEYGPALSSLIELGRNASAMQYQKILLHRHEFSGRLRTLFETIDLLLIPAQPFASPTTAEMVTLGEDPEKLRALLRYTCPFDVSGSPTITLPCGFTDVGTPIAFQFVAPHFREEVLCRAGYAYQTATDWHRRRPKLPTA